MTNCQPIRVHPDAPHYLEYRGRPIILITSAEHYGAVINGDFDLVTYLDALAAFDFHHHLNLSWSLLRNRRLFRL